MRRSSESWSTTRGGFSRSSRSGRARSERGDRRSRMRKIRVAALIYCTWLVASPASAATEPAPILLRFPSTAELNAPPASGLIGTWSFSSLNKQQAAKIALFSEWLPDAGLEAKAREAFACAPIGAPDETCRTEAQLPGSEAELTA